MSGGSQTYLYTVAESEPNHSLLPEARLWTPADLARIERSFRSLYIPRGPHDLPASGELTSSRTCTPLRCFGLAKRE